MAGGGLLRRRAIGLALGAAAIATVVVAVWRVGPPWRPRATAPLRVQEVVQDLGAVLPADAVVHQPEEGAVRVATVRPGESGRPESSARRAIVAPPPSRLRFRVHVPPDAAFELAMAVESHGKRDRQAAGVRFSVLVDGREAFARTLNPARTRHDRRWVDGRIDLGRLAGREVEITLATDTDGAPVRIAGRPAWSRLRVVREAWLERQPASAGAPSVLVLLVDALRADRLGCYGAVPSPSPALDRLARGALVFDTAIAAASWTMPSVATLLTGVYPRTHGVVGVGEAGDPAERHDAGASFLPGAFVTLAEHAARAGITTVGVSANPLVSRATNYAQGFETFLELEWDPPRGHMPGARDVNDAFLRWLAPNRGVRFLGYLHYMDPHDPYAPPRHLRPPPPQGIRPAVANGNVFTLARQLDWRGGSPLPGHEIAYLRALYDAEIQAWDAGLAQLLEALDELGVGRSTVVIVTADHGEEFQEHGLLKHGRHLYEETLRVPLLIAGRGIRPGRAAEPAQGIDLFPTVAALLGAPAPAALPGRDLLTTPPPRPAFSETRYGALPRAASGPLQSVRTAGWKLIHAPTADHFELYDLAQDPAERTNRWGVAPEGAELAALLGSWRPPPPPAPAEGIDPALPRKLRALGYVE